MNWDSFWSMGGYGFYVWGSYGAALLMVVGELALLLRRRGRPAAAGRGER